MEGRFARLDPLDAGKHGEDVFEHLRTEREGWTYLPYGPFENLEPFVNWLGRDCQEADPQFFAVIRKSDEEAVGLTSYLRISPEQGSIEVGHIHFSAGIRNSPITTEAMYLMMKQVFELGYRRYEWKCDALNTPSRQAAQRLGFSFEGVFRQATVYKQRNRDTAWYAAIDSEWPKLRKAFGTWLDPSNFDEDGGQKISLRELTAPILSKLG